MTSQFEFTKRRLVSEVSQVDPMLGAYLGAWLNGYQGKMAAVAEQSADLLIKELGEKWPGSAGVADAIKDIVVEAGIDALERMQGDPMERAMRNFKRRTGKF